jgi:hypothetical protein
MIDAAGVLALSPDASRLARIPLDLQRILPRPSP